MARKRHTAEETVVTEVTSLFYSLGNFRAKTLKLCASIPGSLGMVAKISDKFSVCREFRPGDWSGRHCVASQPVQSPALRWHGSPPRPWRARTRPDCETHATVISCRLGCSYKRLAWTRSLIFDKRIERLKLAS
jgi:hypothetical protein